MPSIVSLCTGGWMDLAICSHALPLLCLCMQLPSLAAPAAFMAAAGPGAASAQLHQQQQSTPASMAGGLGGPTAAIQAIPFTGPPHLQQMPAPVGLQLRPTLPQPAETAATAAGVAPAGLAAAMVAFEQRQTGQGRAPGAPEGPHLPGMPAGSAHAPAAGAAANLPPAALLGSDAGAILLPQSPQHQLGQPSPAGSSQRGTSSEDVVID
jgi:hypothetical protein